MERLRTSAADLGQLGLMLPGLVEQGGATATSLAAELSIVPGYLAYAHIPAHSLRNSVDGLFPEFAKNGFADTARGLHHRYMEGHDLLLDIPRTALTHGPMEGLQQAAHTLLTDFPTKAGIPIPGFSHTGLGGLLEQAGIGRGWLQMSFFDTGIGVFAVGEGWSTLQQALSGALHMDFLTACQTFGAGSVEIALAMTTHNSLPLLLPLSIQNPLLLAGGALDVLAGVVSAWKTISVYVDPLDFFGSTATSTMLGFGLSYGLAGQSLSQAAKDAARSGMIGAMYSVSTGFGLGAIAGFSAFRLGAGLAERHNREALATLSVDRASYELLIRVLCEADPSVSSLLKGAKLQSQLPAQCRSLSRTDPSNVLPSNQRLFLSKPRVLPSDVTPLRGTTPGLPAKSRTLAVDPPLLDSTYRAIFNRRA